MVSNLLARPPADIPAARPGGSVAGAVRRVLGIALGIVLLGLPLYALPQPLTGPEPQNLSVEEILARYYDANGGDQHREVQSMKVSGTSVVMGMEAPYTRYSKRPNMMLLEIYVQDMTGYQAFDGENAWWYMPFMGHAAAEAMPAEMAHGMSEGADFDGPLVDAAGKGHTVELLGIEPVKGRDAYKLQVTLATGSVQMHYLDTETFYTVRTETGEGDMIFLDYRLVEGHPVPRVIEMMGPMGEQVVYIDRVDLNLPLEDSLFRMR